MKIALVLDNFNNYDLLKDYQYIVGVDKGALNALKANINIDYAIGDFDSVSNDEYNYICQKTNCIKLNPIKDETDTLEALRYASSISNDITIFGGIKGNRIEHFIANLNLFHKYNEIKIIDDNSMIFLQKNSFSLNMKDYKYVSLFAFDSDVLGLSLSGFKYELENYNLKKFDSLCISNEAYENPIVTFDSGTLLVILSKEDK